MIVLIQARGGEGVGVRGGGGGQQRICKIDIAIGCVHNGILFSNGPDLLYVHIG